MNIAELDFADAVSRSPRRAGQMAHPNADVTVAIHEKGGGAKKPAHTKKAFSCLVVMLRGRTLAALGWKAKDHGWVQTNPSEPNIIRIRKTSPDVGNSFQDYGIAPNTVLRISFATSALAPAVKTGYVPSAPAEVLLILKDSITLALPAPIIVALTKGGKP